MKKLVLLAVCALTFSSRADVPPTVEATGLVVVLSVVLGLGVLVGGPKRVAWRAFVAMSLSILVLTIEQLKLPDGTFDIMSVMKEKRKIPYGVGNWAELVRDDAYFYVDHTAYIREFEQDRTPVFLCHRRFGKDDVVLAPRVLLRRQPQGRLRRHQADRRQRLLPALGEREVDNKKGDKRK